MPYAQIDENDKPTLLAVNDTTGLPEPIRVDPVLGAVLMFAVGTPVGSPTSLNRASIDANDKDTLLGVNDTTGEIEALRCNDSGYL